MTKRTPLTVISENAVRKRAKRRGYVMSKSRQQSHLNNRGLYMLVDDRNVVVLGADFDASLDEVATFLDRH